jgi:F-type H+-transporting ATPase subunit epsilon
VILADTAERAEEIDEKRAEEAKERAEKIKKEAVHRDDIDFAGMSAIIEKELARTRAAKRWKRLKNLK